VIENRPATYERAVEVSTFLRGLVLGMRCGIVAIDRRGRLILINGPAAQILELDPIAPEGLPIEQALAVHPQLARVLRESFAMASLPNRAEVDLSFGGDRSKTIGFTISMVPDVNGKICGAAVFFKDLTHVEHKEEQERLKDRLASLGQMAANLAHEIRNPLASIEVTCSLLRRRVKADDSGREMLEKIINEVRRLNRTITSSLEYVRPLSLAPHICPVEPMLDDAINVAIGRRGKPGFEIRRDYAYRLPPFLMDRAQLRQVFENLFLNAMEAMGESGELTVSTSIQDAPDAASTPYLPGGAVKIDPFSHFDHYAVIRVADNGPGIDEEHLEKLFYPFFTTKKQGSGVGLSMARKIVDSHRGLLDVESERGKGATFTVRLPMVLEEPEEPKP
jgi:signal transduction histidine kinase